MRAANAPAGSTSGSARAAGELEVVVTAGGAPVWHDLDAHRLIR